MSVFDEPKIDTHAHIFDPVKFPYDPTIRFHPAGHELGTAVQYGHVMKTYGIRHAILSQPNSGYGGDNSYILDTIAKGRAGRFKGMAIIPHDIDLAALRKLKDQGIVGAALNPPFDGVEYYKNARGLFANLAELDMFVQIQADPDQLFAFLPWIEEIAVKVVFDHCGRPNVEAGLDQPGFKAMLGLAKSGRVTIKIGGYPKYSRRPYPFEDTWPYVHAILDAFTPQQCMWGSDWPFLRVPERQDLGPLIALIETFVPKAADRHAVFWETPRRLYDF